MKKIWLIMRVLSQPLYWRVTPFQFRFRISQYEASRARREAEECSSPAAIRYLGLIEGAVTLISVTVGKLPRGKLSGEGCDFLFRGEDLRLLRASVAILKGF